MVNTCEKMIRHGAYCVVLQNNHILLTQKKSGPYRGKWGLPGGGFEFGETPEKTVKRELLEESALTIHELEFLYITTATGEYIKENGQPYGFHQVGLVYRALHWTLRTDVETQEENRWVDLRDVKESELTPFAKDVLSKIHRYISWRPEQHIRGKAIGLAEHESQILVCEVLDDSGCHKGWCPVGGGIDFGETAEHALNREIKEELQCEITVTGVPIVYENLFQHHGCKGHEIVFAFPITFNNPEIYAKKRWQIFEPRGGFLWVEWVRIEDFISGKKILFPEGLLKLWNQPCAH